MNGLPMSKNTTTEVFLSLLSGLAIACLYVNLGHISTVCSSVFVFLLCVTVVYTVSMLSLAIFFWCKAPNPPPPSNNINDKLFPDLDQPLMNSASSQHNGSLEDDTTTTTHPRVTSSRNYYTGCCATMSLIILVFLMIAKSIIGNKRGPTTVTGLDHPVDATIDANGMLHIVGKTHHDVHFAQGLLTAELRLWEMEFQRRVGQGTLSELVGSAGVGHDKMSRTLGLYAAAERAILTLDDYASSAINAYCDGVNAYLNANASLPVEMLLLGVDGANIAPWRPADSLVWGKIMSLELSGNVGNEFMRYELSAGANLTMEDIEQIIAPFNTTRFPTVLTVDDLNTTELRHHLHVVDAASVEPSVAATSFYKTYQGSAVKHKHNKKATTARPQKMVRLLRSGHGHGASNNWVVGGSRTTSGKPMLANDPHLLLTAPSVWIATHLKVEKQKDTTLTDSSNTTPMDVWGASFAGVPGIVTGRNNHIAWGVTNTGVDVQDLFIMTEDPVHHPNEYLWNNKWVKYQVRNEREGGMCLCVGLWLWL